jgi:hypothetical protein
MVGLFTGHSHLKGHIFKLGLTGDPTWERCLEEDESATHVQCDRGHSTITFRQLGQFFMDPGDYHDASTSKVLQFV